MRDPEHASPAAPEPAARASSGAGAVVLGLLLCGGASRRMGRDKASLLLGSRTLLEHGFRALSGVCEQVLLAPGAAPRTDLPPALADAPQVLDRLPGGGPLAGLEAGLARARERHGDAWVCTLACDMPAADVRTLGALLRAARAAEADAALLRSGGRDEPLFGVYHARLLPSIKAALDRGERRVLAFHDDEIRAAGEPTARRPRVVRVEAEHAGVALNLNTPDELADARARAGRLPTSELHA